MIGVTLSPFQVKEGNKILKTKRGVILQENYCNTSITNNAMDGALAIESFCHSGHSILALKEAHRILKPQSKLIIADCFLKKDASKLCFSSKHSYRKLCEGWNLNGLGKINAVKKNLEDIGFKNIVIEDISLKVAPSVFHVPYTITGFILKKIIKGSLIKKQSWINMKSSFYALLVGLHRKDFGYFIVTATKK